MSPKSANPPDLKAQHYRLLIFFGILGRYKNDRRLSKWG